jgi:hypothetical protein
MGLCAMGVAVGYRTPISTILLLMFTVSLHNSNPLIINMGDRQHASALLWACLLPVGRVWSVDQLLRPAEATAAKPAPDHSPKSNWAQLGYVAQIVLLYWMAASHKSLQGWLIEGTAEWCAFPIDIFTWPAARAAACLSGPAATVQPRRLPDPVGCAGAADLAQPLDHPAPARDCSAGQHAPGLSARSQTGPVPLGEPGVSAAPAARPALAELAQAPATEHRPAHD